ncbi:winged helix-turn-helix transcriptional regulator [Streptomyces lydicus]|uniref:winged helix-turn-helix transcriptional regulator n=1 Tax=Streptomyces lydicus TaxID=47763 RepID=UPI0036EA6260
MRAYVRKRAIGWALRVLWELRDGTLGFRPLQQRCDGMSSSVLHQRLTELRESRLVERDAGDGYRLTPLGEGACEELRGLHHWAEGWATELDRVLPDRPDPAS